MLLTVPLQRFSALSNSRFVEHGFILRIPGLDVQTDRESALRRLESYHREQLAAIGNQSLKLAEQIHGNAVATIDGGSPAKTQAVDGLITADPRVVLGIYVADCCAIFLADPMRQVVGLLHSGKKGTEKNIVAAAMQKFRSDFHSEPQDLIAVLSPCIRPPYYEIDFAQSIVAQLRAENVHKIYDGGENTGSDLNRFYSYRMERGRTGRMFAYLALKGN
ncbi:MAG TPA: polyphenol oxidase family protein [Chthoniobacterales bacterium]|nr:polyphenol oxidase family protein [Chthoniobacterales bacterium]